MKASSIDQVRQFHEVFNHPVLSRPAIPPTKNLMFRINFIKEELDELLTAAQAGDLVEVADALGDIRYVLDGFYLECGLHPIQEQISTEIHRSNMSKACTSEEHAKETAESLRAVGVDCYWRQVGDRFVVYRSGDDKVMKALGYSVPGIKPIIDRLLEYHDNFEAMRSALENVVEMKPDYVRLAADHLRSDLGLMLLGESNPKGLLKQQVDKMRKQLVIKYGEEAYRRVIALKHVLVALTNKLAHAESQEMIIMTINAIEAINTGRMYIADEDTPLPE